MTEDLVPTFGDNTVVEDVSDQLWYQNKHTQLCKVVNQNNYVETIKGTIAKKSHQYPTAAV